MKMHVFGNSPSPSIATYGLRRTADQAESKFGSDVKALSAIKANASFLKRSKTPKRVFMRSGPVINTLFNDCPQKVAEDRERLPDNRKLALDRALSFDQNLVRNPLKL
jgi:hypothetical protein